MYERLTDLERPSAAPGRILALDLGEKRIGMAISDEYQRIARPYRVIRRSSRLADFAAIAHIVELEDVVFIVVGLPYLLSEEEGSKAAWIQDYSADLASSLGVRVELHDESFSTIDAEDSLRQQGIKPAKKRNKIDALAAANILQSYLDQLASRF